MPPAGDADEAFRRFLRRVWERDIRPHALRDRAAGRGARLGGTVAAAAGLALDSLLRLRGRPFTRFLAVFGSGVGAALWPEAFDWSWLRGASPQQQRAVSEAAERAAARTPEVEALALFGLAPGAAPEDVRATWRAFAQRYHPDKAPRPELRAEYHLRFVVHHAAYERLRRAYGL